VPRTTWSTCCSRAPGAGTALDISAAIDAVGGEMNAFTSKEYTCFYARVLDTDLPLAVDVVGDLVTSR
jgi:predicted Zn-dependent peptidase